MVSVSGTFFFKGLKGSQRGQALLGVVERYWALSGVIGVNGYNLWALLGVIGRYWRYWRWCLG